MPRRKTAKEYAIRLIHPDLGEYYFNYDNYNYYGKTSTYIFTQTLNKVNTWKTLAIIEEQIVKMTEKLQKSKGKILIPFGAELKEGLSEELKSKMILNRKKFYYPITIIASKNQINTTKDNIARLDESLITDSKTITNMIKKSQQVEKDFIKTLKKFESDINQYRKDYSFLEKTTNLEVAFLDIVDASYGFRYLKLKTLREVGAGTVEVNVKDDLIKDLK